MRQLLRLATAGSVDDGKSTLIGRLLYDSKSVMSDRLEAAERAAAGRGGDGIDLALLTDGLRAEREQGITIDVGYCYFATSRRKFIIADTPGHAHYTRNMFTGASTADLALILVDVHNGVVEQSRRHAFLASLLGLRHVVVCVNKMDLADWSRERFEEVCQDFRQFAARLDLPEPVFVPTSALLGDNVVQRSVNMPWYEGPALLQYLEDVQVASGENLTDARFPVQYVIRETGYRGLAGMVASGVFRPGDQVMVLPSGAATTITAIDGPGAVPRQAAFPSEAVTLRLADDLDVGRGDMVCRLSDQPLVGQDLDAVVCWLADRTVLTEGARYVLQHTTASTRVHVAAVDYRIDVDTLDRDTSADSLGLNDIGRIRLRTQRPLLFDPYRRNRVTGSFILIDEDTDDTVGGGVVNGPALGERSVGRQRSTAVRTSRGLTVWLTGLSAAGKSVVAAEVERRLVAEGRTAYLLDGDNLRHGLNSDLGFGAADRAENVRRVGEVALLFADSGAVAIAALISPYREHRERVRAAHEAAGLPFLEVYMDTPMSVCAARDPKGLYAKALAGELTGFTGVDDPYEAPEAPELAVRPEDGGPAAQAELVLRLIRLRLGAAGR